MAEGLLDIEGSIEKEMEASMLIGRQLNLGRARELALAGDMKGMLEEVVSQVGSEEELLSMNVMQRKALAQSLGLNSAQLMKMVKNQDNLNDMTGEMTDELHDAADAAAGLGSFLKENGLLLLSALGSLQGIGGTLKGIGGKAKGLFGKGKPSSKKPKLPSKKPKLPSNDGGGTGGDGGGTGGMMDSVQKIDMKKVLQGAAAMLIVAAAV